MNWKGKRVLVTGGGGFIGSHLAERLTQLGARTRALVRYSSTGTWGWLDTSPLKKEIEIVQGDVTDRDSVRLALQGMDLIFHLAALISIPYSYQAPSSFVHSNVIGTLNVLQVARELGLERVVHTSTSEVYGTARYAPIDEAHPLYGQSPYSASKIGADKLAEAFHLSFGLPVVIVRPFNTYGPRQSARAIVPAIISQCLAGETIRLGNLYPTRDLSYVTDTVEGFVLAASESAAVGLTINLGSGREITIGDLAQLTARLVGKSIAIESDEQRVRPDKSEVERLVADNTLARTLLGWEPVVSLEKGLKQSIDWLRQHLERYRPSVYFI